MITKQEIENKLREVEEFEAKWGETPGSKLWRKWCTDERYRNNEIRFRQAVANTINNL